MDDCVHMREIAKDKSQASSPEGSALFSLVFRMQQSKCLSFCLSLSLGAVRIH
jgi:hypothetical protein